MTQHNTERRRHIRILFKYDDNVRVIVDTGEQILPGRVLNISTRGIYITTDAPEIDQLEAGMHVTLIEIILQDKTHSDLSITAQIKWVLGTPLLQYPGFGCEFLDESVAGLRRLENFLQRYPSEI